MKKPIKKIKTLIKKIKTLILSKKTVLALFVLGQCFGFYVYEQYKDGEIARILLLNSTVFVNSGTGFYATYKGKRYIVTNDHVCEKDEKVRVLAIGKNYLPTRLGSAVVLKTHETNDLCLIHADFVVEEAARRGIRLIPLRLGDLAEMGEAIYSYGRSDYRGPMFTSGRMSHYQFTEKGDMRLPLMLPVAPGNSGSAVVNRFGEVICITQGYFNILTRRGLIVPAPNYGYCIPVAFLKEMW